MENRVRGAGRQRRALGAERAGDRHRVIGGAAALRQDKRDLVRSRSERSRDARHSETRGAQRETPLIAEGEIRTDAKRNRVFALGDRGGEAVRPDLVARPVHFAGVVLNRDEFLRARLRVLNDKVEAGRLVADLPARVHRRLQDGRVGGEAQTEKPVARDHIIPAPDRIARRRIRTAAENHAEIVAGERGRRSERVVSALVGADNRESVVGEASVVVLADFHGHQLRAVVQEVLVRVRVGGEVVLQSHRFGTRRLHDRRGNREVAGARHNALNHHEGETDEFGNTVARRVGAVKNDRLGNHIRTAARAGALKLTDVHLKIVRPVVAAALGERDTRPENAAVQNRNSELRRARAARLVRRRQGRRLRKLYLLAQTALRRRHRGRLGQRKRVKGVAVAVRAGRARQRYQMRQHIALAAELNRLRAEGRTLGARRLGKRDRQRVDLAARVKTGRQENHHLAVLAVAADADIVADLNDLPRGLDVQDDAVVVLNNQVKTEAARGSLNSGRGDRVREGRRQQVGERLVALGIGVLGGAENQAGVVGARLTRRERKGAGVGKHRRGAAPQLVLVGRHNPRRGRRHRIAETQSAVARPERAGLVHKRDGEGRLVGVAGVGSRAFSHANGGTRLVAGAGDHTVVLIQKGERNIVVVNRDSAAARAARYRRVADNLLQREGETLHALGDFVIGDKRARLRADLARRRHDHGKRNPHRGVGLRASLGNENDQRGEMVGGRSRRRSAGRGDKTHLRRRRARDAGRETRDDKFKVLVAALYDGRRRRVGETDTKRRGGLIHNRDHDAPLGTRGRQRPARGRHRGEFNDDGLGALHIGVVERRKAQSRFRIRAGRETQRKRTGRRGEVRTRRRRAGDREGAGDGRGGREFSLENDGNVQRVAFVHGGDGVFEADGAFVVLNGDGVGPGDGRGAGIHAELGVARRGNRGFRRDRDGLLAHDRVVYARRNRETADRRSRAFAVHESDIGEGRVGNGGRARRHHVGHRHRYRQVGVGILRGEGAVERDIHDERLAGGVHLADAGAGRAADGAAVGARHGKNDIAGVHDSDVGGGIARRHAVAVPGGSRRGRHKLESARRGRRRRSGHRRKIGVAVIGAGDNRDRAARKSAAVKVAVVAVNRPRNHDVLDGGLAVAERGGEGSRERRAGGDRAGRVTQVHNPRVAVGDGDVRPVRARIQV